MSNRLIQYTESEIQTRDLALTLAKAILQVSGKTNPNSKNDVGILIFLSGTLGAGKTIFAKGLLRGLNINVDIVSPTFMICIPYTGQLPVIHADAYRIQNDEEVFELGLDEAIGDGKLVLVEWGEKIAHCLPPVDVTIAIEVVSQTKRSICLEGTSQTGANIIHQLSIQLAQASATS